MRGFIVKNEAVLFWVFFVLISVICYGGFTYLYSISSPPTEAELILKIK